MVNFGSDLTPLEEYHWARREHAWLMRAEGNTFAEIGRHLGISRTQAQQCVRMFSLRMQRAIEGPRIAIERRRWAIAWEDALRETIERKGWRP